MILIRRIRQFWLARANRILVLRLSYAGILFGGIVDNPADLVLALLVCVIGHFALEMILEEHGVRKQQSTLRQIEARLRYYRSADAVPPGAQVIPARAECHEEP